MLGELSKNTTISKSEIGNPNIKYKDSKNNINKIIGRMLTICIPNNSKKLVKKVAEYLPVQPLNQTDCTFQKPVLCNKTQEQKTSAQILTKLLVVKT
jgi:hypothetical protein